MIFFIYKILTPDEWNTFREEGAFKGSELDLKDGFIHASQENQYSQVLEKFFKGIRPVVLIKIDPEKLPKGSLKVEANRPGGQEYPHIYGSIPIEAVICDEVME